MFNSSSNTSGICAPIFLSDQTIYLNNNNNNSESFVLPQLPVDHDEVVYFPPLPFTPLYETHNFQLPFPNHTPQLVEEDALMTEKGVPTMKGSSGAKKNKRDRHSKIVTSSRPRHRRMRLSIDVARQFFDLQEMLGFDRASKTVEWLLVHARPHIKKLYNNPSDCDENSDLDHDTNGDQQQGGAMKAAANNDPKPKRKYNRRSATEPSRRSAFDPAARQARDMARTRARTRTIENKRKKNGLTTTTTQQGLLSVDSQQQNQDGHLRSVVEKKNQIGSSESSSLSGGGGGGVMMIGGNDHSCSTASDLMGETVPVRQQQHFYDHPEQLVNNNNNNNNGYLAMITNQDDDDQNYYASRSSAYELPYGYQNPSTTTTVLPQQHQQRLDQYQFPWNQVCLMRNHNIMW